MDERVYLKVKIKSLGEEARIIRKEEKRIRGGSLRNGLYHHRVNVVRSEARHTHLAYGFLRGKAFSQIENKSRIAPDWKRVQKMVMKYGIHTTWEVQQHQGEWNGMRGYREHIDKIKKELLARFEQWVEQAMEKLLAA